MSTDSRAVTVRSGEMYVTFGSAAIEESWPRGTVATSALIDEKTRVTTPPRSPSNPVSRDDGAFLYWMMIGTLPCVLFEERSGEILLLVAEKLLTALNKTNAVNKL